jgi:hypothetical protein
LKVEDPTFWTELSVETVASDLPAPNEIVTEDTIDKGDDDEYGDDSSIGLATMVKAVIDEGTAMLKVVGIREDGGLVREAFAEDDNKEPADLIDGPEMVDEKHGVHTCVIDGSHPGTHTNTADNSPEQQGRGRRKKMCNKHFANFIRHNDNKDLDIEM